MTEDLVGQVVGTEDSTPLQFNVALREGAYLQLDDVVVTIREVPGIGPVMTSGVVTQVRARHEGASFGSDVFLISDGVLPAQVQEIAEVSTTRVEPEVYVPPRPGEVVRRARGTERAQALYFDRMDAKVPVGRGRDGAPIYINLDFLDGTRGAHVSISGISGVATKTSFALFLLHSIFRSGVLGPRSVNAKALVFSVKGEDLLFLDQPNARLDDDMRAGYAQLGLPAEPFASVALLRPADARRPHRTAERDRADQRRRGVLVDDRRVLRPGPAALRVRRRRGRAEPVHDRDPPGRDPAAAGCRTRTATNGGVRLEDEVDHDLRGARRRHRGPADRRGDPAGLGGTGHRGGDGQRVRPPAALVAAAAAPAHPRRPARSPRRTVSTRDQQLTVVDLHNLHERAQRFVVGVVLAAETDRKEAAGPGGLLFTMIDELNKYAPREGSSPIKEVLLDIAERGRSLGIILIGAQQTASEVERRIVSNSAIRVVGRLDPAEAGRTEYGFLPASAADRGPRWPSRAPCSSRSPRSRCRSRSSSPSRPGPPGWPNAPRRRTRPSLRGPANGHGPRPDVFQRLPAVDDDDIPPF